MADFCRSTPMAVAKTNWMMLERFVFRRDYTEPFPPDEEVVPYRIDDHTSSGDSFSVAFRIAKPPGISRLFLECERGPKTGPRCVLVASHRNLLLLTLIPDPIKVEGPLISVIQYHMRMGRPVCEPDRLFICRTPCLRYDPPDSPPLVLQRIPMCTIPEVVHVKKNGTEITMERTFELETVGILSRGEEEFAVAQLVLYTHLAATNVKAELCVLRSSIHSHDHNWELEKGLSVLYEADEFVDLDAWCTHRVIPFNNCLCWVNYGIGGVLLCDVFQKRPNVYYLRLPILNRCLNQRPVLDRNRSVCVTKGATGAHDLIFVDIVREDGYLVGPLSHGTSFTIAYHVLRTTEYGGMEWNMIFFLTSAKLWGLNKSLSREALIFPHVSMDDPNVVFFLLSEKGMGPRGIPEVSVVTIDMGKSKVLSVVPYFNENGLRDKDSAMVLRRSSYLESFLPSELPKFMNPTCKYVYDASVPPTPAAAPAPTTRQVNINTAVVPDSDCPAFHTRE